MNHLAHIPTMGYTCSKYEENNDSSNLKDVTEWKGFCRETDKWTSLKQTSIPTLFYFVEHGEWLAVEETVK